MLPMQFPGIVNVDNWHRVPDGRQFMAFFCADWRVLTDKDVSEQFKSKEGWFLVGYVNDEPVIVLPGCRFAGLQVTDKVPQSLDIYRVQSP